MSEAARGVVAVVRAVGAHAGIGHVVDVFRGARNATVRKWDHDTLPCHGAGAGLSCAPCQNARLSVDAS